MARVGMWTLAVWAGLALPPQALSQEQWIGDEPSFADSGPVPAAWHAVTEQWIGDEPHFIDADDLAEAGDRQAGHHAPLVRILPPCVPVGELFGDPDTLFCGADGGRQFWEHRTGGFGEYLYLTARGVDMLYATPTDGLPNQVPVGRSQVVAPEYNSGFRAGFRVALDSRSSVVASYTWFRTDAFDSVVLPGGTGFLLSEVTHPGTGNFATDFLQALASYSINFQHADLAYTTLLWGGCDFAVNGLVGVRYARLEQDFFSRFEVPGQIDVQTAINFEGIGPRVGLDAEKLIGWGLLTYGRSSASFLVGEFDALYRQDNLFAGPQTLEVLTGFADRRIVPILELELGLGWQSPGGHFRVSAGYYIAGWFNAVTTPAFVDAVRVQNLRRVSDTITFDGAVVRAEVRY